MPEVNHRERQVLFALALMLAIGGLVRLVSARRPAWSPGLGPSPTAVGSDGSECPGSAAEFDSLFYQGRLDLNAAGEEHLRLLPGIGPTLAERVVRRRRELGRFTRTGELLTVKGIGPKTLDRLRPLIVVRP